MEKPKSKKIKKSGKSNTKASFPYFIVYKPPLYSNPLRFQKIKSIIIKNRQRKPLKKRWIERFDHDLYRQVSIKEKVIDSEKEDVNVDEATRFVDQVNEDRKKEIASAKLKIATLRQELEGWHEKKHTKFLELKKLLKPNRVSLLSSPTK